MKDKILKFFKSKFNISMIAFFALACLAVILTAIDSIFLLIGIICFFIFGIHICIKTYKNYEANQDIDEEEGKYFDATKIDFDEDIYSLDDGKPKIFKKRKKAKFDAISPFVVSVLLTLLVGIFLVVMFINLL